MNLRKFCGERAILSFHISPQRSTVEKKFRHGSVLHLQPQQVGQGEIQTSKELDQVNCARLKYSDYE